MGNEKLESFANAARYLNFTKAAKLSHITQATMSRHIRALEEEIGAPLFIRTQYGVALTEAGKYLNGRVHSYLEQYQDIIEGCKNSFNMPFSKLRISGGPYEHLLIDKPLKILCERFPTAQFNYMSYTYGILSSRFRNRSIDFGFCTNVCADMAGELRYAPLAKKPWQVVAHKNSPFWSLPAKERNSLSRQRIVTMYHGDFEPVERYCVEHGFRPLEYIEANFLHAQILLLKTCDCIAVFPPFVREKLPGDLRMEDILQDPLEPELVAAYDPRNSNEGCAHLFNICMECFATE